jgi:predicted RNase H-like HicB family nuclease
MTKAGGRRTIGAILARPYCRVLERGADGMYTARVLEFPGCISEGPTPDEAIENVDDALRLILEAMGEDGETIPEPIAGHEYSGRISLRIPPSLHAEVARLAATSGISINRFLSDTIARHAGRRT